MFAYVKSLFRKPAAQPANSQSPPLRVPQAVTRTAQARPKPAQPAATSPQTQTTTSTNGANPDEVTIPLPAVLAGFPPQMAGRIRPLDVTGGTLTLTKRRILSQLPSGSVKLPFGEMREAAPQLFTKESDCDDVEIAMPMKEILARMNVEVIAALQTRLAPAVPEEIRSPFEAFGPKPNPKPSPFEPSPAPTAPGLESADHVPTPSEIVSRAASLNGVAGALVALPDGLMVASKLSPGLNGDTLAAFLPQIFSRITRSTKEMGVGEVNNLNFTVDNVPWRISVVNSIFFAAFGCSGQPLPTTQLTALAEELQYKRS